MEEQLISFETAKVAHEKGFTRKEVGFSFTTTRRNYYSHKGELNGDCTDFIIEVFNGDKDKALLKYPLYPATSQSLLQKWLRELHNIDVQSYLIEMSTNGRQIKQDLDQREYMYRIYKEGVDIYISNIKDIYNYEDALEAGLVEGLKLVI